MFRPWNYTSRCTFFKLSLWVLYSIVAVGGRCNTLLKVSLIRAVIVTSEAVLFHTHIMSSYQINQFIR